MKFFAEFQARFFKMQNNKAVTLTAETFLLLMISTVVAVTLMTTFLEPILMSNSLLSLKAENALNAQQEIDYNTGAIVGGGEAGYGELFTYMYRTYASDPRK